MINYAELIKESVSMPEMLSFYGFDIKKGFIICPFHREDTASLKVRNKTFHCYGCGEKGDIIAFVQSLFKISFYDALCKINDDFRLNLPIGRKSTKQEQKHYEQALHKIETEQLKRKSEYDEVHREYERITDELTRLDINLMRYAPKSEGEALHPLFIEAVQNIDKAYYSEYLPITEKIYHLDNQNNEAKI